MAFWTGQHQYTVDQVLHEMIKRCRTLNLRRDRGVQQARMDAIALVTAQTVELVHLGKFEVSV